MSSPAVGPTFPPVDEVAVRAHSDELRTLASEYEITDLRFASAGRLVAPVEITHRDGLPVFDVPDDASMITSDDVSRAGRRVTARRTSFT